MKYVNNISVIVLLLMMSAIPFEVKSETTEKSNKVKKIEKRVEEKNKTNPDSGKKETDKKKNSDVEKTGKENSDKTTAEKKNVEKNNPKAKGDKKENPANKPGSVKSVEPPVSTSDGTSAGVAEEEEEEALSVTPTKTSFVKKKKSVVKKKKMRKQVGKSSVKDAKKSEEKPAAEDEDDIVVTATKTKRKLKDVPVKTEVIGKKKIESKGAKNLLEAVDNEIGVSLDNSCSICNTTSIKLSGMPGRYTLYLVDGMPLYSSLGSTYGLAGIPSALIERIEIVKGASSVLYGTDAIGGVVNIITKSPNRQFSGFDLRIGSHNEYDLSVVSSHKKAGVLGKDTYMGMIIFGSHVHADSADRDGDGITEKAAFSRSVAGANLYLHPFSFMDIMFRSTILQAKRQGGGKGSFLGVINDYDPITGQGLRGLSESILTRRVENGMTMKLYGDNITGEFTMAHVFHAQDSDYEGVYYNAKQKMFYTSPNVNITLGKYYSVLTGAAYRQEDLNENIAVSEYSYKIGGVFAEGNFHYNKKVEVLHGIRFDYHNKFGEVFTPRLAVKYAPLKSLTFRTAVGSAFRAPTTFYEYNHGVHQAGYSIKMDTAKAEQSKGGNFSVNYIPLKGWSFTLEAAYNRVENAIALETQNQGAVLHLFNVDSPLEVTSLEAQMQGRITKYINFSFGYGEYHYKDTQGVLVSAPPKRQFTSTISFRSKHLLASISGKLMAPMDLRGVYGYAYNPVDGATLNELLDPATGADLNNPKLAKSPWYGVMNLRIEYKIKKAMSLYFGVDNIFDFHQSDVETPLMFPSASGPGSAATPLDVVYIWGPLEGRCFYGGIKLHL